MWKAFYENALLLELPVFAMILFMVTFVAVVARVLKQSPEDAARHDEMSRMPLEEDMNINSTLAAGGRHG